MPKTPKSPPSFLGRFSSHLTGHSNLIDSEKMHLFQKKKEFVCCPVCFSTDTVKHGFRTRKGKNGKAERIQRMLCNGCGSCFDEYE